MFNGAGSFNQNIGRWDVSKVTNFDYIFVNAHVFDHSLANWKPFSGAYWYTMQVASSIDFRALTLNIIMRCRALVYAQDVFPMRVGTLTSPSA